MHSRGVYNEHWNELDKYRISKWVTISEREGYIKRASSTRSSTMKIEMLGVNANIPFVVLFAAGWAILNEVQ